MKRFWRTALLLLCLSGCGNVQSSTEHKVTGQDVVKADPSYPAPPQIILEELPVGFEQTSSIGWCDFDRDGVEEEYKLTLRPEDADISACTVSIGGSTAQRYAFAMEENPYLVSLDGETVQLAVFDDGMSDDPHTAFYRWDGTTIHTMGTLYAAPADITIQNGQIIAPERCDIMQNAWFSFVYTVENDILVRQKDADRWYPCWRESGELTTAAEVPLFGVPELTGSVGMTVPAETAVEMVGVAFDREIENLSEGDMPFYWVKLKVTETGEIGYLLANAYQCRIPGGGEAISADTLFSGLIHAG